VIEEGVRVYDVFYQSTIEAFTEPVSKAERAAMLAQLDLMGMAQLVAQSPQQAVQALREIRAQREGT
jgi:hypothetical protein